MRIILIFLDGVGLGPDEPRANPLARSDALSGLTSLCGHRLIAADFPWQAASGGGRALDATLGVPGLPQSASGQTALFTGVNAPAVLGFHQNGFPGVRLQKVLAEHSIFRQLRELGHRATFANAFTAEYFARVAAGRWWYSASTLSALAGGVRIRLLTELLQGQAVYQDLTRDSLRARGYEVPLCSPEQAGFTLAHLARDFEFTLFEYFQTDLAGHAMDADLVRKRLRQVDAFLVSLLRNTDLQSTLVAITSDHGNLEDLEARGHTLNHVPLLAFGRGQAAFLDALSCLDQVTPAIIKYLENG